MCQFWVSSRCLHQAPSKCWTQQGLAIYCSEPMQLMVEKQERPILLTHIRLRCSTFYLSTTAILPVIACDLLSRVCLVTNEAAASGTRNLSGFKPRLIPLYLHIYDIHICNCIADSRTR